MCYTYYIFVHNYTVNYFLRLSPAYQSRILIHEILYEFSSFEPGHVEKLNQILNKYTKKGFDKSLLDYKLYQKYLNDDGGLNDNNMKLQEKYEKFKEKYDKLIELRDEYDRLVNIIKCKCKQITLYEFSKNVHRKLPIYPCGIPDMYCEACKSESLVLISISKFNTMDFEGNYINEICTGIACNLCGNNGAVSFEECVTDDIILVCINNLCGGSSTCMICAVAKYDRKKLSYLIIHILLYFLLQNLYNI